MMEARCTAYCIGGVQASSDYTCNICKYCLGATRVEEILKHLAAPHVRTLLKCMEYAQILLAHDRKQQQSLDLAIWKI